MKPNKPKKVQEKDQDPQAAGMETGLNDLNEKEIESDEASSEENNNPGKEPYVDFSKLF